MADENDSMRPVPESLEATPPGPSDEGDQATQPVAGGPPVPSLEDTPAASSSVNQATHEDHEEIPLDSRTADHAATPETAQKPDHKQPPLEKSSTSPGAVPLAEAASVKAILPTQETQSDDGAAILAESRKHTRRSFVAAVAGVAAGYGFYRWLDNEDQDMMQPTLLRRTLQANAALSRAIFDERGLTPTYPLNRAEDLRVNGIYGLKTALVPESWRLQLVGSRDDEHHPRFSKDVTAWEYRYSDAAAPTDKGHDTKVAPGASTADKMPPKPMLEQEKARETKAAKRPRGQEEAGESDSTLDPGTSGLLLTMDDIMKLPRHELVTQFKCIEGWSQIVHWAGVRMADFLEAYPPALIDGAEPKYVYMETPNGDYYTGYDMSVCRHPQTLLVTEMMGAPLTQFHGAPLRLHMPTKYGYKQIKCIGLISYTNDKPDDYWTKLGYDWYAGL